MHTEHVSAEPATDLLSALSRVAAQPLWDRYQRLTRRQPTQRAQAQHWPWATMAPLIDRAVAEVSMEDAERRVLLLTDPELPAAATTTNLLGGLQTLMPGETAQAHRHTIAALRLVLCGEGATTSVNNEVCAMAPGDLVLTPAWTWHRHHHAGSERMVWFDGLDLPLCAHLDTMFFEIDRSASHPVTPAPTRAAPPHPQAVALPPDAAEGGSRYRYAAARARAALAAAPVADDGASWLRYVDGISGGPVLPSLDCYLLGLAPGRATATRRSTAACVCVVLAGEGQSIIGDRRLAWQTHDVFTLPSWQWARHEAGAQGATLFLMSDRELLASLAYLREETMAEESAA